MTATATERNTITETLLAHRDEIPAGVLQVPSLGRAVPSGFGAGPEDAAARRSAAGRAHLVFRWG